MKKLVMISLASTAVLMMFAQPANAQNNENTTDVGVSFKSEDGTDNGKGPYKDNLALVFKPSAFEFGEQKAIADTAIFSNTFGQEANNGQYIVVNDDRPNTELPVWSLKAQLTELTSVDDATKKLDSTKLSFNMAGLQSYKIGPEIDPVKNDYVALNPAKNPETLGTYDASHKVSLVGKAIETKGTEVTLVAGDSSSTMVMKKEEATATKGGYATKVTDAKLTVTDAKSSDAAGKTYKGTINWTLDNTITE